MTKLTATGRYPREPEIQNLPGTPAYVLEMYYARRGTPFRMTPDDWETSAEQCLKCEGYHVEYRVYDGPGPASNYLYRCNDCNHSWWVYDDRGEP